MFKRIITTLISISLLAIGLSACTGSDASGVSSQASKTASMNGTWKADGFEAEVSDNLIEVNIVDQDTSSLYWKGTFPQQQGEKITSEADVDALSESMLGSQDLTKEFTVKGGEISFKITIMGTSKVVHLKKG